MAVIDPDPTVAHLVASITRGGHGCDYIPSSIPPEKFHAGHHNVNQPVLDHDHGSHHDPAPADDDRPDPDLPAAYHP